MRVVLDWLRLGDEVLMEVIGNTKYYDYVKFQEAYVYTIMGHLMNTITLERMDRVASDSFNRNYFMIPTTLCENIFRAYADSICEITKQVFGRPIDDVLDDWYIQGRQLVIYQKG